MTEVQSDPESATSSAGASTPRPLLTREFGRIGHPKTGNTLVVLGGVHGNERAGLYAGRRVLDAIVDHGIAVSGQLVVLAGNLAALNHEDPDTRYIDHDLNRLCKREHFDEPPETSVEHAEMHGLFDALTDVHEKCTLHSRSMIVLDLHTTSAPSRPVVAFEDSLPARVHAMRMPCPKYLGIEEEANGLVIDAVTNRLGCISYLVEGGQHNDPASVDVHEAAIWIALDSAGILDMRDSGIDPMRVVGEHSGHRGHVVYDVRHREPIADSDFAICPGIESGTMVEAGKTLIAHQAGREVKSPINGRMFLPNMQMHKRIGDDGFFIVRRVSTGWVNLSARLRSQAWVHRVIGWMPGVYRSEDSALLVDADLACVLRRQVFHLFGYRLVRHDGRAGGVGFKRIINGTGAFLRALFRGPIRGKDGKGPDPEDPRFWIVQRRRLDR